LRGTGEEDHGSTMRCDATRPKRPDVVPVAPGEGGAAQERCLRWLVCHCGQRLSSAEPGVRLGFREGRGRWAVAYPPTASTPTRRGDAGVHGEKDCGRRSLGWARRSSGMYIPQPTGSTSHSQACFGLDYERKKSILFPSTITKIWFFSCNYEIGYFTSLNFFKPCMVPPSSGLKTVATVTAGGCYSNRSFVFSFFKKQWNL